MARTKKITAPEAFVVTEADMPMTAHTADANALVAVQADYSQERDLLNQLMGQIQMAEAVAKLTTVVSLTKLAHIKETKMYRAFAGKKGVSNDGNEIADVGTWEGFCLAVGTTRQKADEDITNLKVFGEKALENMTRIGAGYREMRQFRRLPEDQKTALIEAAKEGDKDAFLELAEDLIAKHSKEKEALANERDVTKNELSVAQEDLESSRKRVATLTTKLQGRKLTPPTPDEKAAELIASAHEAEATACAWIEGHLKTAISEALDHDAEHGCNHRAVLSGFIARIEDATDALRLAFALPRIKTGEDDPFAELPDDFLEKQGVTMPKPINVDADGKLFDPAKLGGKHAAN